MTDTTVSSLRPGSFGCRIARSGKRGRPRRVVTGSSLEQIRMLNTVETGKTNLRIVLEQINDAVNELERHVAIKHIVDVPRTHLRPG